MTLRVFPVAGGASYSSDYNPGDPSRGRTHLGNDLFNKEGTPLLAVDDGEVRYGEDGLGGHVANLYAKDNTKYYYAHQSAFEGANRNVQAGEVIGYMGHTGNAINTPTHLHFQVHPNRGQAVDPYPLLKQAKIQSASASPSSGPSKLTIALVMGAVGLGVWAYTEPASLNRLLRKIGF